MRDTNELERLHKEATAAPWIADHRIGCDALYSGEPRNCLSGVADECIAYQSGYREDNGAWTTDQQKAADYALIAELRNAYADGTLIPCPSLDAGLEEAFGWLEDGMSEVAHWDSTGIARAHVHLATLRSHLTAQADRLEALEAVCDQHGLLCKYDRLPCEHDHACIEVGPDCGCVRIGGRR